MQEEQRKGRSREKGGAEKREEQRKREGISR